MPTALITGAAGGIGLALVETFNDAGYQAIATDCIDQPPELDKVKYHRIDLDSFVEDPSYSVEVCKEINQSLEEQGLNVLINNAAIQILGGVESLRVFDWRKSLNVNLLAPFLLTQALLPHLERVQGCVINISSIHARLTKQNFVAYATTKAALSGMTRAMAVDLGARVRVNAIEPAAIATPMLRAGFGDRSDLYNQLEACHPLGRIGTSAEVAEAALALASNRLRFIHGECLSLDGGIGARLYDPT